MHAAERLVIMLMLWKDLHSAEKVVLYPLKLRFPSSPRSVVSCTCTQFLSCCLDCWAGSEQFASARFQLRPIIYIIDGSVVWKPILWSERTLPCWGSLEVRQWPGEREMGKELHTLRFWCFVRILPDDFSLRRFLANFSVCHELLDLFFVISEANTFRQGKVVMNKSASFFG